MATTIDTTECPYCGYINAIVESDYEERFRSKNKEFDIRNNCPLCNWEKFENNLADEKDVINIKPKPNILQEAKKIVRVINETEVSSWIDELITDYILDKFEDLRPEEKLARTFFIDLVKLIFEKRKK